MNKMKVLSNLAGMAILVGMTAVVHAVPITNTVTFGGDVYMCPQNGIPNRVDCSGHVTTQTWMFDIRNPDLSIPMGLSSYVISLELYDDFLPAPPNGDNTEPEFAMFSQAGVVSIPISPANEMRSPFEIDGFPSASQIFSFDGSALGLNMLRDTGILTVSLTAVFNPITSGATQGVFGDDFFPAQRNADGTSTRTQHHCAAGDSSRWPRLVKTQTAFIELAPLPVAHHGVGFSLPVIRCGLMSQDRTEPASWP